MSAARQPARHWGGRPVYSCSFGCGFERVEGLGQVLAHEAAKHTTTRVSPIAAPDGGALIVTEES